MDKEVKDVIAWLEDWDFVVDVTRPHCSITHPDVSGVSVTMFKTKSDWRSFQNALSRLENEFASVPGVPWRSLPGRSTPKNRTLVDQVRGTNIVDLVMELKGTRGEAIFEERSWVKTEHGVSMLVITNPWYVQGSEDVTRSQRIVMVRVPPGNQYLDDLAVEALASLGIDLTRSSKVEMEESFVAFADEQWKQVKPERLRIRNEWLARRQERDARGSVDDGRHGSNPGDNVGREGR